MSFYYSVLRDRWLGYPKGNLVRKDGTTARRPISIPVDIPAPYWNALYLTLTKARGGTVNNSPAILELAGRRWPAIHHDPPHCYLNGGVEETYLLRFETGLEIELFHIIKSAIDHLEIGWFITPRDARPGLTCAQCGRGRLFEHSGDFTNDFPPVLERCWSGRWTGMGVMAFVLTDDEVVAAIDRYADTPIAQLDAGKVGCWFCGWEGER